MSELEQQILDLIQDAFPLVERPYKALAEMLNELAANCDGAKVVGEKCANPVVSEQVVFEAVESLRSSGVIRRIGGVYDSKKLGFISRLCAGKVPVSSLDFSAEPHEQTAMENFAAVVNEVPAITHNYIRSHEYNVWFTVIAENETAIQAIVDKLCNATDLHDVHVMSATRKFKINTVMKGGLDDNCERRESRPTLLAVGRISDECGEFRKSVDALSASDKFRICTACEDIPHSLTPFKDWDVSCEELREDLALKRMRRFGAILRHQDAGFPCNAMVCFRLDEKRMTSGESSLANSESAGSLLAKQHYISHCYERPSFENFPYNLYAMMHAQTPEELDAYIKEAVALLDNPEYVVLHSLKELKKTSFRFFA